MLRRSLLVIALILGLPTLSSAADFRAFFDLDDDPSTGCTISTVDGPFDGAEEVVIATVTGGQVVSVQQQTCDLGSGTLNAPVLLVDFPTPWNVGVGLGTAGTDVVEAYLPLAMPLPEPASARVGFDADDGSGGMDALITTNGTSTGGPIVITTAAIIEVPTLSSVSLALLSALIGFAAWRSLRRRPTRGAWVVLIIACALTAGSVLAVGMIVLDGDPTDWIGSADASAMDPFNDGTPGADLAAAFVALDPSGTYIYSRFDVAPTPVAVAVDDSATVLEDAAATAIDVLANENNPAALPVSITAIPAQPPFGTVIITGVGSGLTYQPDADACNNGLPTDDFIYELNGATTATVSVTVTCVNDEPVFTAGADQSVDEDSGAQTVAGWATGIDDSDPEAVQGLTFDVTNDNNALFSVQPAVDAAGTLTYTPAAATSGMATVSVFLMDDGGTANGGDDTSPTQTFTITVASVNNAPVFTAGANETVDEDAGAQNVAGWATGIDDSDPEVQMLTFNVSNDNNVLFSAQPAVDAAGNLTYTPAADANGSASVDVFLMDDGGTANGGDDTSPTQTFTITVNPVNDEPAFTAGANETVNEDAGAQTVNGWATGLDDSDPEATQTLSFNVTNDNNALFSAQPAVDASGNLTYTPAADANGSATVSVFLMDNGGTANGGDDTSPTQMFTITVNAQNDPPTHTGSAGVTAFTEGGGAVVVDAGIVLADVDDTNLESATVTVNVLDAGFETLAATTAGTSIVAGYVPATGTLTLMGTDTIANYQAVLRSVTYNNTSTSPTTTNRTVTCIVNDGDANSLTSNKAVSIGAVNSPPTVTSATIAYTAVGNTLLRVDGADADNHDTALPGRVASTTDIMDAIVKSGAADADGPSLGFTPKAGEATDQGGMITLDDDGDFFYTPPIGFTGVDTETLVLTDSIASINVTLQITVSDMVWYVEDTTGAKNPAGNTDGRSTDAFQTLAAAAAAAGPGHTILLFETDAPIDETISLQSGQKLYGQRVEEETVSLLPTGLLLEEIADTNARPQVHRTTGPAVTVDTTGGALANVEIRHLDLQSGDDDAIAVTTAGTNTVDTLLIDENVIGGAGAHGIDLNSGHTTGEATVEIRDNQITSTTNAIDVAHNGAGTLALAINGNTNLNSSGGAGIQVVETAGAVTITSLDGNSVSGDTGGVGMSFSGVTFDGDTATAAFEQVDANNTAVGSVGNAVGGAGILLTNPAGDLLFDDLDVESSGDGVTVTGTGEVNTGAGTGFRLSAGAGSTINAAGGAGLNLQSMTAAMTLASVSSSNSTGSGIRLNDVAGTVNSPTGTVTGSAGPAFFIDQDTVTNALNMLYNGTATNTADNLIRVEGLPSGTLTFNGPTMSDSGAGANTGTGLHFEDVDGTINVSTGAMTLNQSDGTGINVAGDTDGTINFDNIAITSPASTAIQIVDGADRFGGTFDFDNVDVTHATDGQRMLDVQGLGTGASVDFSADSALMATDGTGINISSNAGNGSVTFAGPVDLGTSGSRISDGQAFTMASNAAGNTITIPDLDVFTSGQTAVGASGSGTLDIDALSVDTASNGRGLDLTGIVSAVVVDSMTCANTSACVNLTSLAAGSLTTAAGLALNCTGGSCFNANLGQMVEVLGGGNQVTSTRTAVSLVDTGIGPNHATFQAVNVNGGGTSAVPAIVLDSTGAGRFHVTGTGAAGTGGTVENILLDAVRLSTTGGLVTFEDMIIEDIGNMGGAADTVSSHDAIHGELVNGGLTLDNVTIRRISDAAVHGVTLAGGAATVFNGLQIINSTIEDTNRYHVANIGDDNNEAMVRIRGLTGTVNVTGSTLQRGGELMDLNSHTSGNLNMTLQNSSFRDSFKGIAATASAAGLACVNLKMVQAANAVVHVGDPAEASAALGNVFEDCATVGMAVKHLDENSTGDITAIISRNTFTNDISFGPPNPFGFGNVPSTGILLRPQGTSTADLNAIVSHNTLTNQGLVEGLVGAISVQFDSAGGVTSGTGQVRISDNTVNTPIGGPIFVRAERNTAARVLLRDNVFTAGVVSQPDFGASSHPGNSTQIFTREGGQLDVTIEGHFFPAQDTTFVEPGESFKARTFGGAPGTDRLCVSFACPSCAGVHTTSDLGYGLRRDAGTLLLHRGGSASMVAQTILQDNGVRGGGGNPAANPPTVGVVGAITPTTTACALPTGGIF